MNSSDAPSNTSPQAHVQPHTPGPWIACNMVHAERGGQMTPEEIGEYVANCVRLGDPARFLFVTTAGDEAPDICHVGNGPAGPANARLIAAAPEMLEALEAARPFLATLANALSTSQLGGDATAQVLAKVNAAIRKATGADR